MLKIPLLISILLFLFTGCKSDPDIDNNIFDGIAKRDTLTIEALYRDCGEWGGHKERIKIFLNDVHLTVQFQKDSVNCLDPSSFNRHIIEQWTKEVTVRNQEDILDFLHATLNRSLKTETYCRNSNSVKVNWNSAKLVIKQYNCGFNWTGFKDLKEKLKADIII